MIEIHERCGGKVVITRDGSTCGCGTLRTRRIVGIIYAGGTMDLHGRRLSQEDVQRELTAIEEDWASALAEACF